MPNVFLAVDNVLLRESLSISLGRQTGVRVVVSADGGTGPRAAAGLRPDVIVTCDRYPETPDVVSAEYRKASPRSKIILLLLSHRPDDLDDNGGADAAVDGMGGLDALMYEIRRVTG